jgi:hypothetical protein
MNLWKQVLLGFLAAAPALLIVSIVLLSVLLARRKSRVPVRDKLLRAPGETLQRRLERFDSNSELHFLGLLIYAFVCFALFVAFLNWRQKSPHVLAEIACYWLVIAVISAFVSWKVIKVMQRYRNDFLGLRGERAVGEELNKLMLDGCLVYHDVPGEGDWNVDHVVVAPAGVYAIETKTRRKAKCADDRKDYEVIYDGRTLQFPTWTDTHGIEQAKASAKWLSKHLSNALAEQIKVTPVLTLPGWLVTSRVSSSGNELRVLSHKQIRSVIVNGHTPVLDDKRLKQIGYQLELKCRDVEF